MEHRFDLLGSGWVSVECDPKSYRLSSGNQKRALAIRQLIDSAYNPIDWQLDFKSGYRWRADRLSGTLRYGHEPAVDVKVPWELARLHHLSWLAQSGDEKSIREFRNQVLDFAAANPPGYGVNWLCTMDVAIRAANIIIAYDLFISQGIEFDEAFLGEFHALIVAHGKHIMANLEWHDVHRANHYLADIVGLLFVAAYLPCTDESNAWLIFSVEQMINEVERQFTPDGANFEASTSYHRLSAEMVVYGTALVLGLPKDKKAILGGKNSFPDWYFERLERMAEFCVHVTKPNGRVAQIGDNDSGRFFKICPSFDEAGGTFKEQHLDHRSTVAAINGLFEREDFEEFSGPDVALDTTVVSALAGGQKITSYLKPGDNPGAMGVQITGGVDSGLSVLAQTFIEPVDATVLNGLTVFSYPDFGLFIWRSSRFFMSVRCGPVGQNGNGGHAHNDQLAIELNIDGEDWIADPGTYLYTPAPNDRNAYRSVHAHAAPKIGDKEPSRLDFGLFRLENNVDARCLCFSPDGFEGRHAGYGVPLHRHIEIQDGKIRITDLISGTKSSKVIPRIVKDGTSLRKLWSLDLRFSPGYGIRD
ncbi:MAG: alginate lyase family protein [Rhodospirillaceae bacterium]|nr:alginate lyase family protein [Rhodospirillaceae bacterium]MBL6932863.1 alginate lyase family protein [Rhodospirillales bacterium]